MARLSPIRSFQVSQSAAQVGGERKSDANALDGSFAHTEADTRAGQGTSGTGTAIVGASSTSIPTDAIIAEAGLFLIARAAGLA
ncbi:hypothetical protein I6F15_29790 [Bradyrhizobium sp. BRP14]|nr:hypothetical protein [Bradyrhizobium sp. BRP14]